MSLANLITFAIPPVAIIVAGKRHDLTAVIDPHQRERAACEEAHARGLAEGRELALAELAAERAALAGFQRGTLHRLASGQADLATDVARLLPELALEIARRVVGGVEFDLDAVRRISAETLAEIDPGVPGVELWLSERDFALAGALEEEFSLRYPGIRLRADPDLVPGDCRARSRFGAIDGRLATKLENIATSFA